MHECMSVCAREREGSSKRGMAVLKQLNPGVHSTSKKGLNSHQEQIIILRITVLFVVVCLIYWLDAWLVDFRHQPVGAGDHSHI